MGEMLLIDTPRCQLCRKSTTMVVDFDGYRAWQNGVNIQDALPEMNADDRELLMTGTHAECWERMFPEEDE